MKSAAKTCLDHNSTCFRLHHISPHGKHYPRSPTVSMVGEIDLLGPDPLFRQVAAVLARRIADGTYEPNRAIPSGAEIASEFGVSRKTAGQAVALLKRDGLVVGVQGRGVFVADLGETDDARDAER